MPKGVRHGESSGLPDGADLAGAAPVARFGAFATRALSRGFDLARFTFAPDLDPLVIAAIRLLRSSRCRSISLVAGEYSRDPIWRKPDVGPGAQRRGFNPA